MATNTTNACGRVETTGVYDSIGWTGGVEKRSRGESTGGRSRGGVTSGADRGGRGRGGVGFEGELGTHPEPSAGRSICEDFNLGEPVTLRGGGGRARL